MAARSILAYFFNIIVVLLMQGQICNYLLLDSSGMRTICHLIEFGHLQLMHLWDRVVTYNVCHKYLRVVLIDLLGFRQLNKGSEHARFN